MNLNELTIKEAHAKLQSGEIFATELAQACLRRIEKVDPQVHAFLRVCGEQAMAELGNMVMQADATKMIGVISLISLVYLIILFFGYGRFAQIQYDAMKKKGRI